MIREAADAQIICSLPTFKKKRSRTLHLLSCTRCPFNEPRTGRAASAVGLNNPGGADRRASHRTSKHAKWWGKDERLRRGSHVFPASATHSQGNRRLRRRGRRGVCDRVARRRARPRPPAAAPVGSGRTEEDAPPNAINATTSKKKRDKCHARSLPLPASHQVRGLGAEHPAFAGLLGVV